MSTLHHALSQPNWPEVALVGFSLIAVLLGELQLRPTLRVDHGATQVLSEARDRVDDPGRVAGVP